MLVFWEYVGREICNQMGSVYCSAVICREHILSVSGVAVVPCFIGELVDDAGTVVTLIEGYGDQSGLLICLGGRLLEDMRVPGSDGVGGEWGHPFGLGETRVKEPETGDLGGSRLELVEAVDGGANATDGDGSFGDGAVRRGIGLFHRIGSGHGWERRNQCSMEYKKAGR